jgi:group I intron endonuclease
MTRIYVITNTYVTPNKQYVGKTVHDDVNIRLMEHVQKGRKLDASSKISESLRYYGLINHKIEIVETCDDSEALKREQFWIEKLGTLHIGYNIKNEYNDDKRSAWYDTNKDKVLNNLSVGRPWNYNITMTDESKTRISETKAARKALGLYDDSYGHAHTQESREKISSAKKEFYENGGVNPQSLYYNVYVDGVLKCSNLPKAHIVSELGLSERQWRTIIAFHRRCSFSKTHKKTGIKLEVVHND